MLATQFQWTLRQSSLSGSEEGFRAILKSTFSKTIILVQLEAFLKLRDFRTRPETFEMGPTRMPLSTYRVASLGSPGTVLQAGQGVGRMLPLAAA